MTQPGENVSRLPEMPGIALKWRRRKAAIISPLTRGLVKRSPQLLKPQMNPCDCEAPGGIVYFITTNTLGQGSIRTWVSADEEPDGDPGGTKTSPGPVSFEYRCFFSSGGFTGY